RLGTPAGATPEFTGTLRFTAEDLAIVTAATALEHSKGLAGVPLTSRIAVALTDKRVKLESDDFALAETRLKGSVELDFSKSPKRLDARLSASRIDLSRALIPILDERPLAGVTPEARNQVTSWWPEAPFDLDRLDGIEGTVTIDTPEFLVANGIALRAARLESTIKQGALDIRLVEGAALGGKTSGRFALTKASSGAALKASLRI